MLLLCSSRNLLRKLREDSVYFMSTVEDSIKIPSMASADLRRCSQVKKGGKDKLRKILLG